MSVKVQCGCGKFYLAKRKLKYGRCPDCALRAKQISEARLRDRQRPAAEVIEALENGVVTLMVVHDPLEIGGFSAGTTFDKEDIEQMLRLRAFTPGTTLTDCQGRLYRYGMR